MHAGLVGDGRLARLNTFNDRRALVDLLDGRRTFSGVLTVNGKRGEVLAQAFAFKRAVKAREHSILVLEHDRELSIRDLILRGARVEHESVAHRAHVTVGRRIPHRGTVIARGARDHRGGAAAVEVHGVIRAEILEKLTELGEGHAVGVGATAIEHDREDFRAILAHANRGTGVARLHEGVITHGDDFAVREDLIAALNAHVDVLVGADRDVDLVANLERRDLVGTLFAAKKELRALGDLLLPHTLLDDAARLDDLAVLDEGVSGVSAHLVGSADRAIERVGTPARVVHADLTLGDTRVVEGRKLNRGTVGKRGLTRGRERLHHGLAASDRKRRALAIRANDRLTIRDRAIDRRIAEVNVEEGRVDRGNSLVAALARGHEFAKRGPARDRTVVHDVH